MKTFIAFFSWSGNTLEIAKKLAQRIHGDLFCIERAFPYSIDYNTCVYTEAKEKADEQLRPAIKPPLPDLQNYDAALLASPIWWYTMPAPVMTFLESYADWNGKKLIVFANSHSDSAGQFVNALWDAVVCAKGADARPGLYHKDVA